jgi:hypothetical protein
VQLQSTHANVAYAGSSDQGFKALASTPSRGYQHVSFKAVAPQVQQRQQVCWLHRPYGQ